MLKPSKIIGDNYLHRWHLLPRNALFNIYLHKFMADDDDRALHDHPWFSVSFLLRGRLDEITPGKVGVIFKNQIREVPRFRPVFRRAKHAHRLKLIEGPAWTIFITGPRIREWGFLCPKGWVHWREFTDETGLKTGAGCGD